MEKEATVVNRTEDGVVVSVLHPYWFGTENAEADTASEAQYFVTESTTQRVTGDEITPC